jgi:hypothetical protein
VLGKRVEEEASNRASALKVQRTWLWGEETRRAALVLYFAAAGQILDSSLIPGASFAAELVYFSGSFPQRALLKNQKTVARPEMLLPGYATLLSASEAYAAALACNPWLELFPMALEAVTPFQKDEAWGMVDREGRFVPFEAAFPQVWTLVALSGGRPLNLFGEWNGEIFRPLSACVEGRFIILQSYPVEG